MNKIACIIPARYKSSRFPGKPLEMINGKPLIQRVYENAKQVELFDDVIVTMADTKDDFKIVKMCRKLNINYMITSSHCNTGTCATAEIARNIDADIYVNLQGDECLIMPDAIRSFVNGINEKDRDAFNGMTNCDEVDRGNMNIPKVVTNVWGDLLYISRLPIPYDKSTFCPKYFKELGIHAYTKKGLMKFMSYWQEYLEKAEQIEFLRFLESGEKVQMIYVELPFKNHAVDVPDDIKIVEDILDREGIE